MADEKEQKQIRNNKRPHRQQK